MKSIVFHNVVSSLKQFTLLSYVILLQQKKRKSKETIFMIRTCSKLKFQTLTMMNFFFESAEIQNESLYKNHETTYQNPFRIGNLK